MLSWKVMSLKWCYAPDRPPREPSMRIHLSAVRTIDSACKTLMYLLMRRRLKSYIKTKRTPRPRRSRKGLCTHLCTHFPERDLTWHVQAVRSIWWSSWSALTEKQSWRKSEPADNRPVDVHDAFRSIFFSFLSYSAIHGPSAFCMQFCPSLLVTFHKVTT